MWKSCDIGQYLDYKNCKYRKKLVDNLVEKYSENIDENKMIYNGTLSGYENVCSSCTVFIVFFVIAFLITICLSKRFKYFNWYVKRRYIEQQFIRHINGKYKTNKCKKWNILIF